MISDKQVEDYRENGFVVVEKVLPADLLAEVRHTTDEIVACAQGLASHDEVYDLEDSHTPEAPRVRRIKRPHNVHPLYRELAGNRRVLAIVTKLLGPNVRHQGGILNMKSPGFGAPIEWHQDWVFYPHTNDDLLVAGLFLDDVTPENGAVLFVPGSHRGPLYDHHAEGRFCGAIGPEEGDFDTTAVPALGRAGDMSVHHCRVVHASALNRSARPRRVLYYEFNAADAWPILGLARHYSDDPAVAYEVYNSRIVAGEPTDWPRMENVPVQVPYPEPLRGGSIYETQSSVKRRKFEVYRGDKDAAGGA